MSITPIGGAAPISVALGTVFDSLASDGNASTAAIDNTVAGTNNNGHAAAQEAELWLVLGSAITTGSGAPYLAATVVDQLDGTNYETSGVFGGVPFPLTNTATEPLPPATTMNTAKVRFPVRACVFQVMLYNASGAAFPATVTATLFLLPAGAG